MRFPRSTFALRLHRILPAECQSLDMIAVIAGSVIMMAGLFAWPFLGLGR